MARLPHPLPPCLIYNIHSPPLSFVRSGVVDLYNGSSKYVGRDGYNWGSFSTAFDSIITAAAYFLDIPPSYVLPSHGPGNRWTGFPIRCLAIIIASPPLSFVRSGTVILGAGSMGRFGLDGYGWSSASRAFTSVTSATAYLLDFRAPGVYPSGGPVDRYYGFPIR